MPHFTTADGDSIKFLGDKMKKKLHPVYMLKQDMPGTVETNEGVLKFKEGDFIAFDEISGHVWPVDNDYVEAHYDFWTEQDESYENENDDDEDLVSEATE